MPCPSVGFAHPASYPHMVDGGAYIGIRGGPGCKHTQGDLQVEVPPKKTSAFSRGCKGAENYDPKP